MRRFLLACMLFLLPSFGFAHDARHSDNTVLQPGDVGYRHAEFHQIYKKLVDEVNGESNLLGPGDYGYRNKELAPLYKQLYASRKCACKAGYCRPTDVRLTELGAESGYDVKINEEWFPAPLESLQHENTLSRELMSELMKAADAHVCAYDDPAAPGGQRIECVVIKTIGS